MTLRDAEATYDFHVEEHMVRESDTCYKDTSDKIIFIRLDKPNLLPDDPKGKNWLTFSHNAACDVRAKKQMIRDLDLQYDETIGWGLVRPETSRVLANAKDLLG